MFKNPIDKLAVKTAGWIAAVFLLCHFTKSAAIVLLAAWGVSCALRKRFGYAWGAYLVLGLSVVTNVALMPKGAFFSLGVRFGFLILGAALAYAGLNERTSENSKVPLLPLVPYLLAAALFSIWGFAPIVSELKLVQFFIFLYSLYFGLRGLVYRPEEAFRFRAMTFGVILVFVFGSALAYFVPSVGYSMSLGGGMDALGDPEASMFVREQMANAESLMLFSGITGQSQVIGALFPCFFFWLACDMLFVEGKVGGLHLYTLITMLPIIYLSRSRLGLLGLLASFAVIYFYLMPRIQLSAHVRDRVRQGMFIGLLFVAAAAITAEVRSQSITRWLRKTENVGGDTRSLKQAVTDSRQGLIQQSLWEYRRSPLIGSGFQVSYWHVMLVRRSRGLILSAPIEKGLTPLMVLGETGIFGSILFWIFIVTFLMKCGERRLRMTLGGFLVFFAANMGEATFFSPGGIGGAEWIVCLGGGFLLDITLRQMRRM